MLKDRTYQVQAEIQGAVLSAQEKLVFVENDAGYNCIEIRFTQNGLPYIIEGATVELVFRRPDGVTILGSESAIKDKVLYKLGTSELFCPGTVMMQVSLLENNARLTAGSIPVYVEKELPTDDAVDSSLNYPKVSVLSALVLSLESRVIALENELSVQGYDSLQAAFTDIFARLAALETE